MSSLDIDEDGELRKTEVLEHEEGGGQGIAGQFRD